DRAPEIDLLALSIGARIARRVTALAIGDDVEEDRSVAALDDVPLAPHRIDHGERVVAVDHLGVEVVHVEPGGDAGEALEAHRLALRLASHAVEIVHEEEDDRKAAAIVGLPQVPELAHGREVEGLPHRAAPGRGIADVRDRDARLALHSLVERRADRDVRAAADERVVEIDSERREERVHRAAEPASEARLAPEDLREEPIREEGQGPTPN